MLLTLIPIQHVVFNTICNIFVGCRMPHKLYFFWIQACILHNIG